MIEYVFADGKLREQIAHDWGEKVAHHLHLEDGFTLVALHGGVSAGLISVQWRKLPLPFQQTQEGFIDIIVVRPDHRLQGIGRRLVEISIERARSHGATQLRAWSSEDKIEAIPMWKALGFGLCPATTYPGGQEVRGYFVTKTV